jgi:SAM-dependent methyltransferase
VTDPTLNQARSFGTVAQLYDRHRPTYAAAAVTWALGERPRRVADLGAGTGILSRLLRDLGHEVIAVEPDEQMRAHLVATSPGIAALAGSAEEIPLPDASVDAVVAGQAYHWFDTARALPEIARVLRPEGRLAVLRNDPDPAAPWTVRFAEIIDGASTTARDRAAIDFGTRFGPTRRAEFRHEVRMTPDDLVAVATTRSPYLVADADGQRALVEAVRALAAGPEIAGRDRFAMAYLTLVQRTALGGDDAAPEVVGR